MPFYEYECASCKFYSEVMQKITDPPLSKCPSCGKNTLKKLLSAPVFRLKGAGWYETDFKSEKEGRRNLAEAEKAAAKEKEGTAAATDKSTEKSTDKPAAAEPAGGAPAKADAKSAPAAPARKSAVRKSTAGAPRRAASKARTKAKGRAARKARR
jgi:putative FmdB family regulatory protein